MLKKTIFLIAIIMANNLFGQIDRVEPPNWWVGFKDNSLQLLVHGPNISKAHPVIGYEGVKIEKVTPGSSPNYLFIDLLIDRDTQPGVMQLKFEFDSSGSLAYNYTLKARTRSEKDFIGFDSSDVIYLITPDRFVNGDPDNDIDPELKERTIDRNNDYARHGGDIKGINDHLDYISNMGFTAIWPTPLLTNDMPKSSYHGYAMTDFYEVDPRFGTLDQYRELAEKARKRGIKLIMDQVANHCGSEHWWMKDLPFDDWVNYQKDFEEHQPLHTSNHRRTTNQDPYASKFDKDLMHKGWFVSAMPDLDQRNPFMAKYIIQNSIWWIETLGLGGIRQDTYPYSNKEFMATWAGTIMKEYPDFNIVGEEWSYNPLLVGYWQQGAHNKDGYQSHLKSTMDFPMQRKIVEALNEPENWDTGLVKIYEGLAN
ncbi:MAG: cyclomaltodextrinase N-terminal domain-containing protein, partial [Flavobacteriaceae bacterium]|nr:cyclomaltodextrinase N-terminal domain-containing protein [Flavobacteriaceae bacterium]